MHMCVKGCDVQLPGRASHSVDSLLLLGPHPYGNYCSNLLCPLDRLRQLGMDSQPELAPSALVTPIIHTSAEAAAVTLDLNTQSHKSCCKSGGQGLALGRKTGLLSFCFF